MIPGMVAIAFRQQQGLRLQGQVILYGRNRGQFVSGDVTFVKLGIGDIYPAYNATSYYAGNINVNYPIGQISFAAAANGRLILNGSVTQSINDLSLSSKPLIRVLQVNNTGGGVVLNEGVEISSELDLDDGIVYAAAASSVEMNDNAVVSSVSDTSHVDGPVLKFGDDAFVFPVGDSGVYLPISISAPVSTLSAFQAEYFSANAAGSYDDTQLGLGISHVSDCEYWELDRLAGTDNVTVTLAF